MMKYVLKITLAGFVAMIVGGLLGMVLVEMVGNFVFNFLEVNQAIPKEDYLWGCITCASVCSTLTMYTVGR